VRGDWINLARPVIDVGINRCRMRPKVDTAWWGCQLQREGSAGFITPVPGGVGPLTIAMLMKNTLRAAELQDK
jgi:methylenetetrahydrofolate dehydrogenase (NADP+)/methenyltetrahydrofolate cyclohydrolase